METNQSRYWMCIIGPVEKADLPDGADSAPRRAAVIAAEKMLGKEPENCWSGWGLTQKRMEEIQRVWNKSEDLPDEE